MSKIKSPEIKYEECRNKIELCMLLMEFRNHLLKKVFFLAKTSFKIRLLSRCPWKTNCFIFIWLKKGVFDEFEIIYLISTCLFC